jgi:hypothetical protein
MSSMEHSRYLVFNPAQHPLKHDLSDLAYINPIVPGVTSPQEAFDYIFNVLYPKSIGTFANMAALLAAVPAPNPNDYAFIQDDGDGRGAGYCWMIIEGAGQWYKRYDVDWSMESVLAETVNRTTFLYVQKYGMTDQDGAGVALAGIDAGQHIYGGDQVNQHLTLHANAADTTGTITGFIQSEATFRPTQDATFDLGTGALQWSSLYLATSALVGTTTIAPASITDSTGTLSLGTTDLVTTGNLSADQGLFTTATTVGGTLTCSTGNISDSSGAISFGSNDLSTSGTITGGDGSMLGTITFAADTVSTSGGTLVLGADDVQTTGIIDATAFNAATQVAIAGDLILGANTISATSDITLSSGSGHLFLTGTIIDSDSDITTTGVITALSVNAGNLQLAANTLSSTNVNGNINITPNGSGVAQVSSHLLPSASNAVDLGSSTQLWRTLYLGTALSDGATQILTSELLALRSTLFRDAARTQAAQDGDSLFFDSVSGEWLASAPDTEIDHSSLTGLVTGDAGHTQFVMLTGRAGGQVVQGGTAASENLTLESTSHVTKGSIRFKDTLAPNADNTTDIGTTALAVKDFYSKGQFFGFRAENKTSGTLPAASGANAGRLVFATDTQKLMLDTGGSWIPVGSGKYMNDTSWDGSTTTQTFTMGAGTISDCRAAIWQLCDNANNYERIIAKIEALSATQVRVTSSPALPAGSYRLIGLE